ncbi:MAG: IS30 family transposase, partial [Aliishimia sp.]
VKQTLDMLRIPRSTFYRWYDLYVDGGLDGLADHSLRPGSVWNRIPDARRSITFDRGTEFVSWPHLQAEIGTQTWFCDPSSPWQKGTVENTNRRARRWLPRKRDIRAMTDQDIKAICDQLNNTPHKCLGWKTPAEVFREKMMEEMDRSPYPQTQ